MLPLVGAAFLAGNWSASRYSASGSSSTLSSSSRNVSSSNLRKNLGSSSFTTTSRNVSTSNLRNSEIKVSRRRVPLRLVKEPSSSRSSSSYVPLKRPLAFQSKPSQAEKSKQATQASKEIIEEVEEVEEAEEAEEAEGPQEIDAEAAAMANQEVPFSIQKATSVPCGVWVNDGSKKWRVVDRRQKSVDIRTIRKKGKGKKAAGKFGKPNATPETVQKDDFGYGKLQYGTFVGSASLLKNTGTNYGAANYITFAGGGTGGAPPTTPTFGGGTYTAGGGVTKTGGGSDNSAQTSEEGQSKEESSDETTQQGWAEWVQWPTWPTPQACALEGDHEEIFTDERNWTYWPSSKRRLSRGMTLIVGLALMFAGGLVHLLSSRIDWEGVWCHLVTSCSQFENCCGEWVRTGFGYFAEMSSDCLSACPGLDAICPEDVMSILKVLVALIVGTITFVFVYMKAPSARFIWGTNFPKLGFSSGAKEQYQVSYSVELTERDWKRFQGSRSSYQ